MKNKKKTILILIGAATGIAGICMIYASGGWQMAIGVFLAMWSNNVSERLGK